jgi:hypothetical protein
MPERHTSTWFPTVAPHFVVASESRPAADWPVVDDQGQVLAYLRDVLVELAVATPRDDVRAAVLVDHE